MPPSRTPLVMVFEFANEAYLPDSSGPTGNSNYLGAEFRPTDQDSGGQFWTPIPGSGGQICTPKHREARASALGRVPVEPVPVQQRQNGIDDRQPEPDTLLAVVLGVVDLRKRPERCRPTGRGGYRRHCRRRRCERGWRTRRRRSARRLAYMAVAAASGFTFITKQRGQPPGLPVVPARVRLCASRALQQVLEGQDVRAERLPDRGLLDAADVADLPVGLGAVGVAVVAGDAHWSHHDRGPKIEPSVSATG